MVGGRLFYREGDRVRLPAGLRAGQGETLFNGDTEGTSVRLGARWRW